MSQLKIKNGNNWESIPAGGIGVPSGGTTGQVLQKSSNTDYATEWADIPDPGVNVPFTTISANLSFEVKNSIVFVYANGASASANSWTTLGTIPDGYRPSTDVYSSNAAYGSYHNGGWLSMRVKTNGNVDLGNSTSTARTDVNGYINYII